MLGGAGRAQWLSLPGRQHGSPAVAARCAVRDAVSLAVVRSVAHYGWSSIGRLVDARHLSWSSSRVRHEVVVLSARKSP